MISYMDCFRGHPLVSRAHHVCLPTDLDDMIDVDSYRRQNENWLRQKYAMGIPNMFSSHAQPSHDVAKQEHPLFTALLVAS